MTVSSPPAPTQDTSVPKRRVLHVLHGLDLGGIELWVLELLRRLDPARYEADVLVLRDRPGQNAPVVRQLGGAVFTCARPGRFPEIVRVFGEIVRERGPYAIVHSHVHHYSGLIVWLAARHRIPLRIVQSHNDTRPDEVGAGWRRRFYLGLMKRSIRRHATARVGVSSEAAEDLFGPDWRRNGAGLLHCGVDFTPFAEVGDRAALLGTLGLPEDALVIGHVGRFHWRKNHPFLLEIAQTAFARDPRARLLSLGDGPTMDEIREKARTLGIAERIVFAGARTDVPLLMTTAMDVLVLPSHYEGLSLASLEAQAAGLPLLLSDGLTREGDVVPGLIARLPLAAGADAWAGRLLELARAPKDRAAALERMNASRFAIDRSLERVLALYEGGGGAP